MEEVYPSWPTALVTVIVLFLSSLLVWLEAPGSAAAYITILILLVLAVYILLAAAKKFPLYKLR